MACRRYMHASWFLVSSTYCSFAIQSFTDISVGHPTMEVLHLQFSVSWALLTSKLRFNFPPFPYQRVCSILDNVYCIASPVETWSGLTLDEPILHILSTAWYGFEPSIYRKSI